MQTSHRNNIYPRTPNMPYSQLSLKEAAAYLHISPDQMEKLAREENLCSKYIKDRPVFSKCVLHDWLSQKLVGGQAESIDRFESAINRGDDTAPEQDVLFLSQFITPYTIDPELNAKSKSSVLRELVKLAAKSELLTDEVELLELIEEREALCPTGLVRGVAMPHSRSHSDYLILDSFLVIARLPDPIPFGSQDGELVDLFLMPCASNDKLHLHMIARIALLLQKTDLADELRACTTATEMAETVESIEKTFTER